MTNTFHFTELTPLGLAAVSSAITPLIDAFYTTVYGFTNGAANYVQWTNMQVNWYDLSQPPPRAPLSIDFGIPASATVTTVPTEVSAVLSFQGDRVSGVPQSRRRGRIYLGGLGTGWIQPSSSSAFPTLSGTPIATLGTAAETLRDAAITAGARWSVWSPTDQEAVFVTNGWVDNGPDTQRRRSVESSNRFLWS